MFEQEPFRKYYFHFFKKNFHKWKVNFGFQIFDCTSNFENLNLFEKNSKNIEKFLKLSVFFDKKPF